VCGTGCGECIDHVGAGDTAVLRARDARTHWGGCPPSGSSPRTRRNPAATGTRSAQGRHRRRSASCRGGSLGSVAVFGSDAQQRIVRVQRRVWRVPKSGQLVHAHRDARVGRKRATRGAMPATVSLIAHPQTTQPSRCATPINPRPRTLWRNVPAWCGGHGFGHGTLCNRRELAGWGEIAWTAERR
jgi:hypothetical protein